MIVTLTLNPSLDRTVDVETLERGAVIRTSEPVLASKSASIRNTIQAAFDATPKVIVSEPSVAASGILAIARALGDAMPPAAAVQT